MQSNCFQILLIARPFARRWFGLQYCNWKRNPLERPPVHPDIDDEYVQAVQPNVNPPANLVVAVLNESIDDGIADVSGGSDLYAGLDDANAAPPANPQPPPAVVDVNREPTPPPANEPNMSAPVPAIDIG